MSVLNWISLYLVIGITFQCILDKQIRENGGWNLMAFIIAVFVWPLPISNILYQLVFKSGRRRAREAAEAAKRLSGMSEDLQGRARDAEERKRERDEWGN